jgi:hypothetical protein
MDINTVNMASHGIKHQKHIVCIHLIQSLLHFPHPPANQKGESENSV